MAGINKRITYYRKQACYTKHQMAEKMGLKYTTYCRIEDNSKINSEQLKKLSETLRDVEKVIYEKINYLLDADVAESFFSIMGPLSPLASGQFFVESVIDAIGQAIQIEIGERVKKVKSKIRKHTSKYHG